MQGNIATWNKKEGDEISAGDSIAEIETDKVRQDDMLLRMTSDYVLCPMRSCLRPQSCFGFWQSEIFGRQIMPISDSAMFITLRPTATCVLFILVWYKAR